MINSLAQSRYSAFISYAHADDEAWFGWITQFRKELERSLKAMLRGIELPPVHQSGDNGPIAGVLAPELRNRVEQSFAMVIVVHDNYVQSEWCRKELEYFVQRFGTQGCAERLYIVAMSVPAVQRVAESEAWRRLLPGGLVWMPFVDPDKDAHPVEMYLAPQLVAPTFRQSFVRFREDFVGKLKASSASAAPPIVGLPAGTGAALAQSVPPSAPAAVLGGQQEASDVVEAVGASGKDVRIYIESNRNEVSTWQSLGEQMRLRWESMTAAQALPFRFQVRALPVEEIEHFATLDDADGVVLLWGKKSPDALVAQINKVENKMSAVRDAAPGVVAYLMPPQRSTDRVPAWGWPVLRFNAESPQRIDVVNEESDELQSYLRRVLDRRLARQVLPAGERG